VHPLAHDRLRAGHLPRDLGIRALVEDPRADGIALRHGQSSQQPVQQTDVGKGRELFDPLEVAVLEDDPLVAQPRAGRTLDLGTAAAVEQLVLGNLEQPARGRTSVRIEPLEAGDDRRERLGGQIERELARVSAPQVVAGDDRQPSPVELRERLIIATCGRAQQVAVIGACQPHTQLLRTNRMAVTTHLSREMRPHDSPCTPFY
jgi:hypothetical protein